MDHIKYNSKLTLPKSGLENRGVQCHFNSMIQGFLSCTSVIEVFKTNEDGIQTRNILCKTLWEMIQKSLDGHTIAEYGPKLWNAFMLKTASSRKKYGNSQEDAQESFVRFLDALDAPEIEYLFEHRYTQTIICNHCNHKHKSLNEDTNTFVEFHQREVGGPANLQTLILKQNPPMDEEFKCVNAVCGKRGNKQHFKRLGMTPEIIVVMFKKFDNKWLVTCPEIIDIPSPKPEKPYQYRLVAVNEHGGDQGGGHYWARALRRSGPAYLNDATATDETGIESSCQTYLVWYHII